MFTKTVAQSTKRLAPLGMPGDRSGSFRYMPVVPSIRPGQLQSFTTIQEEPTPSVLTPPPSDPSSGTSSGASSPTKVFSPAPPKGEPTGPPRLGVRRRRLGHSPVVVTPPETPILPAVAMSTNEAQFAQLASAQKPISFDLMRHMVTPLAALTPGNPIPEEITNNPAYQALFKMWGVNPQKDASYIVNMAKYMARMIDAANTLVAKIRTNSDAFANQYGITPVDVNELADKLERSFHFAAYQKKVPGVSQTTLHVHNPTTSEPFTIAFAEKIDAEGPKGAKSGGNSKVRHVAVKSSDLTETTAYATKTINEDTRAGWLGKLPSGGSREFMIALEEAFAQMASQASVPSDYTGAKPVPLHSDVPVVFYFSRRNDEPAILRSALVMHKMAAAGDRHLQRFALAQDHRGFVEEMDYLARKGFEAALQFPPHRDLKPANIFIGHNDEVYIGDFGSPVKGGKLKMHLTYPTFSTVTTNPEYQAYENTFGLALSFWEEMAKNYYKPFPEWKPLLDAFDAYLDARGHDDKKTHVKSAALTSALLDVVGEIQRLMADPAQASLIPQTVREKTLPLLDKFLELAIPESPFEQKEANLESVIASLRRFVELTTDKNLNHLSPLLTPCEDTTKRFDELVAPLVALMAYIQGTPEGSYLKIVKAVGGKEVLANAQAFVQELATQVKSEAAG